MRYPEFLKEHGTIGFVAPSFGCAIEPYRTCFDSALQKFHDRGFATEPGPNCYEGSGIGLATVKKIVKRFNGKVTIEGWPNKGCCVTVQLPANNMIQSFEN